jgi:ferrous iron transport protein B
VPESTLFRTRDESLAHLKRIHGDDAETLVADARYGFISGLVREVLTKPAVAKVTATDRIDRVMLNRWLGIPFFLAILFGIFELTFVLSVPLVDWLASGLSWLAQHLEFVRPDWLGSLIRDGVIGGVGAVVAFVPVIFLLYICLSILEDTGYLARAAFVMDRLMHRIGLHGRSFLSLIIGFGCNVPAVMASRTIENPRDRLVTILVTPLMSCGARLPVFVLLAAAFFTANQGLVVFSMYGIGVVAAIGMAWLFRRKLVPGESGHFVMELPPYRLPTVTNVAAHVWERGWAFISRAGTFIFMAVFVIWLMDYLNVLEGIGRAIAPVFGPTGFGQWQAAVALIFGVFAKETVVGAFGTLFGAESGTTIGTALHTQLAWTPLIAYGFMLMMLLYIPCVATLTTIKRETGSWKWTIFTIVYTLVLGWVAATLVYQVGRLLIT